MRLIESDGTGGFRLTKDLLGDDEIPPYGILSHTWQNGEEVTFNDIEGGTGNGKSGYKKIEFCMRQAKRDDLHYIWVDTCCINKSDNVELQHALNSMFRWYENAVKCYVFLSDVSTNQGVDNESDEIPWGPAFRGSRWFTRCWTLQELLAPMTVEFYSKEGNLLGTRQSLEIAIHEITGIQVEALQRIPLRHFDVDDRFSWAENRRATREEDKAYALLGIFGIFMVPNYGEGEQNAVARLRRKIAKATATDEPTRLSQQSSNTTKQLRRRILGSTQCKTLLDSLRFKQIDMRHATIKDAHPETCRWLTEHPDYTDWLDESKIDEHHGFLWIKGKPGAGKSTLMKFAVANARETMDGKIIISFFFNARGEHLERSTIGTYRSLLLQLLERLPTLQAVFALLNLPASSIHPEYSWGAEPLKMLLREAIQSLETASVVCFIDALDECDEQQIRDMVTFFEHVGELTVSNGINFHVCFSSRHYPHISIQKALHLVLEGQMGHNRDILNYIEKQLKIGQSQTAQIIRKELQKKASGVFMWVALVVSILNKEYDRGRVHALQRRLQEIPSDLHQLFREILTCDLDDRYELLLCIQWLLFSKRRLTPSELYFAILSGSETDFSPWDKIEISDDAVERFVLDASKGLAECVSGLGQRVQLIHESVRDFLLERNAVGNIWPELEDNFQGLSHDNLRRICMLYMDPFFGVLSGPGPLTTIALCNDLRENPDVVPFLEYAIENVLYHADLAENLGVSQEMFVHSFPLASWIRLIVAVTEYGLDLHRPQLGYAKQVHAENASLAYHLAMLDLPNLFRLHFRTLMNPDLDRVSQGTSFYAALSTFVDPIAAAHPTENWLHNLQSHWPYDSVSWQVFRYAFLVIGSRDALSYLAGLGDVHTFTVALQKIDRDFGSSGGKTTSPLIYAAQKGFDSVVKLLLHVDAINVDIRDDTGRTPVCHAVIHGHNAILKVLLQEGNADVNIRDVRGRTALSHAAEAGNEEAVSLILGFDNAYCNVYDEFRRTPLLYAAMNGNAAIARMLLEIGQVKVDVKDDWGRTPLSWAAATSEAVVRLLLETRQVEVDVLDRYSRTPLSYASENRADDEGATVKLLLDTNKIDINKRDWEGRTPLSYTAGSTNAAAVRLLLDTNDISVDEPDSMGSTPLAWAATALHGSEAVVEMLLRTNSVDAVKQDLFGRTPLSYAAEHGNTATAALLLQHGGFDFDSDQHGRTALDWARIQGHEAVVSLLRSHLGLQSHDPSHQEQSKLTHVDWADFGYLRGRGASRYLRAGSHNPVPFPEPGASVDRPLISRG